VGGVIVTFLTQGRCRSVNDTTDHTTELVLGYVESHFAEQVDHESLRLGVRTGHPHAAA
jgi:hypothetical protein